MGRAEGNEMKEEAIERCEYRRTEEAKRAVEILERIKTLGRQDVAEAKEASSRIENGGFRCSLCNGEYDTCESCGLGPIPHQKVNHPPRHGDCPGFGANPDDFQLSSTPNNEGNEVSHQDKE